MTREPRKDVRISHWQTTIKWVIALIFGAGVLFSRMDGRISALEKDRDDWKAAVTKLESKLDKVDTKINDIHAIVPLIQDHLEKDVVLKPSDLDPKRHNP